MPGWSCLLRVLLSVALIFNGAATAGASVHIIGHTGAMAAVVAEAAAEPALATAEEDPSCREHRPVPSAEQRAAAADTDQSQRPAPDCCQSDACRCACVHHAPAAIVGLDFHAPLIEHAASVRPMSSGHADPALPHLIRPPIG
jgi:hypothetical protein